MTFYNQELQNIGKIITLGSLNLCLSLNLEKSDIQSLDINIKNIIDINDLYFILENEHLWDRIELSSESVLLNTLFHMNRIKRIKNIVAYLVYDKIDFTKELMGFQKLLDFLLLVNGVVIYTYEIYKCRINIYFNIIYKNITKKIVLYESGIYDNTNDIISKNEDKEEKKAENEEDIKDEEGDIGLFDKIPENQVNFNDFKFLYIHFGDYVKGGEFYNIFKLKEFYFFLKRIKKNNKTKIIINFGENLKSFEKDLIKFMKISDFHIFRNKTELFDILMKKKEIDDLKIQKNNLKLMKIFKEQKKQKMKKIKAVIIRNGIKSSSNPKRRFNQLLKNTKSSKSNSYNNNSNPKLEHRNQSLKNLLINKTLNLSFNLKKQVLLNKNNIYTYIHDLIYNKSEKSDHTNKNEKLGIYLDDFKSIYILNYKRIQFKPEISEFDFGIYPKPNIHNLSEIQNIKHLLNTHYSFFSYVIYGCILSTILDDISKTNENYYLFYYYIRMSIIKILSVLKNGMQIPKEKSFYLVELKKNELNKIISDENAKKKEIGFNINYLNSDNKEKENKEDSLFAKDKFGTIYLQGFNEKDNFKTKQVINGYRTNNKNFLKFIWNQKLKNRGKNLEKGFWTKRQNMGFSFYSNGSSELSVYLSKEQKKKFVESSKLPPLRSTVKSKNKTANNFRRKIIPQIDFIKKEIIKANEKQEIIDISKYKEIKFQSTPNM